MVQRYKDTPEAGQVAEADKNKIMHISLPIGKGNVLMATDALESMGRPFIQGNNFYLSVNAETEDEANKLFNALSEGGITIMPMANTFWGSYFGMANDKFGTQWMVSFDKNYTP